MYLKALRMRGFKSFPGSVELRFEPGIAVVVGPNGSGKSNIADALQWAMAVQSPSQLRAPTGLDVLFGGSDSRPPAGVCEGELVLDNSALDAVKMAERYPALPDAMRRDVLPVVAIFTYSIRTTQSSVFQLLQ